MIVLRVMIVSLSSRGWKTHDPCKALVDTGVKCFIRNQFPIYCYISSLLGDLRLKTKRSDLRERLIKNTLIFWLFRSFQLWEHWPLAWPYSHFSRKNCGQSIGLTGLQAKQVCKPKLWIIDMTAFTFSKCIVRVSLDSGVQSCISNLKKSCG